MSSLQGQQPQVPILLLKEGTTDCFLEQFADETKKSGGNFFTPKHGKCEESFDFSSS